MDYQILTPILSRDLANTSAPCGEKETELNNRPYKPGFSCQLVTDWSASRAASCAKRGHCLNSLITQKSCTMDQIPKFVQIHWEYQTFSWTVP